MVPHTGWYIGYSTIVSGAHPSNDAFAPVCLQGLPVGQGQGQLGRYEVHQASQPEKRLYIVQIQKKKLTCPCGIDQILHLLLSAGLGFTTEHINYREFVMMANQGCTGLQLWLTADLDLAIVSGAIPPQVKNSDDAKLVIRQGSIYDGCGWRLHGVRITLTYRQVGGANSMVGTCTTTRVSRHPPPKWEESRYSSF